MLVTFVTGSPPVKVSTVKVQEIPVPKLAIAGVPENNADLELSENGEDFDLDMGMRQVDADEMNNADEMAENENLDDVFGN